MPPPPQNIATFNFQQPQQQLQQYQPLHQALPSTTSATSTTRLSTPGPTIYDIIAIDTGYSCEGDQPPDFWNSSRLFNINQLNRKDLRGAPRGLLRRWGILCDTRAAASVAPRNFADHVPLQPRYAQLALLQQPTNLVTSMATKTSCSCATTSASRCAPTSVTSKHHCWDYATSLTAK